jgi:ubiquinone/menaquinone biosynthesis C-methylase UbiE
MSTATAFIGNVPQNYDRYLGPVLFEPYAIDLARRAPAGAASVLELACGTGRVTHHLDKLLAGNAHIIASDLNADMLAIAQKIVFSPRIEWMQVDAQQLPFGASAFDLVLCQFGVMFFPDKALAFREVRRVLQPGGKFIFNTWDSMAENPRARIIQEVLQDELGEKAPDFFSVGPYSFFDENQIRSLLEEAGFDAIRIEKIPLVSRFENPDDIITGFVDGSPLGAYLDQVGIQVRMQVRDKLRLALEAQFGTYGLEVPMQAIVVSCSC